MRIKTIRCSDRMCGADDCPNCRPENFQDGKYINCEPEELEHSPEYTADQRIIENMISYGGSFVKSLGLAARNADPDNLRRIKETWPEYWFKYSATFGNASQ